MSYIKRDWDNTSNDVTKEDFKRIENGVEANDIKINVLEGKTSIPVPFNFGLELSNLNYTNKIQKEHNRVKMICNVKRYGTDMFAAGTEYSICALPAGYTCTTNFKGAGSCCYTSGLAVGVCSVGCFNNTIYATPYVACEAMFFLIEWEVS